MQRMVGMSAQAVPLTPKTPAKNLTSLLTQRELEVAQIVVSGAYYQTRTAVAGIAGARKLAMLGVVYYLSKRSNLYADIDYARLSGRARIGTQTSQTGVSIGIDHLF